MQMYSKLTTVWVALILLAGCDGEGTLLDLYPWEPMVNPEVRTLIQDNGIVHAQLGVRDQVSGITRKGSFETQDRFGSFVFEPHSWEEEGLLEFGNNLIVRVVPDESAFSLLYSWDNGQTWNRYGRPIVDQEDMGPRGVSAVELFVGAENVLWLLCQRQGGTERSRLLLYQIDLTGGTHKLLLRKPDASALTAAAFDANGGWVLWEDTSGHSGSVHVLRTTDGGRTWSDGATLENVGDPLMGVVNARDLLVFGEAGTAFRSANGGMTFEPVGTGMESIQRCQAVTAATVYVLSEDGRLGKSTDGGLTWTPLVTQAGNTLVSGSKMDFQDERRGIVYGDDRMFFTESGGEHWEVWIYPYDYVLQ